METIFSVITSLVVAFSGTLGIGDVTQVAVVPTSSEVGISELSPAGPAGGFAMPASGCSASGWHGEGLHDCDQLPDICIVGNKTIIRQDETVDLCWDPNGIDNCVLVGSMPTPGPVTNPGTQPITPPSDTTYQIICDNNPAYSDTVTVRVLPRIQET